MNFIFTDTLSFIDLFVMCRLVSEINGSRTHSYWKQSPMHSKSTFHALFATFDACKQIGAATFMQRLECLTGSKEDNHVFVWKWSCIKPLCL